MYSVESFSYFKPQRGYWIAQRIVGHVQKLCSEGKKPSKVMPRNQSIKNLQLPPPTLEPPDCIAYPTGTKE